MSSFLNRDSTTITVAEFYERFLLQKYDFNPPYQRRGDVWDDEKQSFLIDTIIKNYPMPPIFLHQRINENDGKTRYDIIDGKQRLNAIIRFLRNEIPLPQDFDEGLFGDSRLNGVFFRDLSDELVEFRKQLWRYSINIEYIESNNAELINNIFDRLNRNGEPLSMQELRHAKYGQKALYKVIKRLKDSFDWNNLSKVKFNRMQDDEFISELLFYLLENEATDASQKENLDLSYEKWSKLVTESESYALEEQFGNILNYLSELYIDFNKYKIKGVSHFYAIFALCKMCIDKRIPTKVISKKVAEFYTLLRSEDDTNSAVKNYRYSMQLATKSKRQRQLRINSLAAFCGV